MFIDFLRESFRRHADREAVVWGGRPLSYRELDESTSAMAALLEREGLAPGSVVSLEADFSPASTALLLALIERGAVIVPLASSVEALKPEYRRTAEVEAVASVAGDDSVSISRTGRKAAHPLIGRLRSAGHPGLIVFSSGSTGKAKASAHDFVPLLEKFQTPRKARRMIAFLLFDHLGGINTLLYSLSNGGTLVVVPDRSPDEVAAAVAAHKVEVLPATPTFLNLLVLSEAYRRHDLSSLALITYGTEPMPESTLRRLTGLFPRVEFQQTYGLSELGVLRTKSRGRDSLWLKVGGEGFQTRVCDGLLEIKARSAMLGYLNAESPFTEDGYFKTGDMVETDGEWFRILGRKSEMINVGGRKVFPAEVESLLQAMDGVEEALVSAESNPLTGQIVRATVRLAADEPLDRFKVRMRAYLKGKLDPYKIPARVVLTRDRLYSDRFKRIRSQSAI